jgi:DnaJ-domain-containing protein 1
MSTMEIVVIGVGLAIGYKFVSAMMVSPKGDAAPGPDVEPPLRIDTRRPWHEVLGVSPEATRAEIDRAYRALIEQYHPDKFNQHGDDIREIAQKRAKELNAAYYLGCSLRPD